MDKDCYVNIKNELLENELLEAEFIGVFQYSHVLDPSPMIGGHSGGVIAYPIAVVKLDEKLKEVKLSDITFKR
ncbi:hypothetical protein BKP37_12875 [Anaerobacillus alkalilacustris]|uniref:Uncharacterized protein n=1 Tax=Anaerobacillus alkalilacustris TaxID=393763 RepID=A0A1S2LJH9_9BACI|nr:hypothetical protein [Anaerobacillus alkalilacustris]OIJ12688.1 hypothetical protein BKP37_12875 [Anaerobacillus alkalilacustris]